MRLAEDNPAASSEADATIAAMDLAMDLEELRVTAYHEAGHAVAAVVIEGGAVDAVTIVPSGDYAGLATSRTRAFGWEHVIAGPLAGAMSVWFDGDVELQLEADFLIDGMFGPLADHEHCDVAKIIGRWATDAARIEEARRNVDVNTDPDLARQLARPSLRALAHFELECVTEGLCDNWPAVEAVAEALRDHRTLDGDQVEELIGSAPKRHPWKRKNSRVRRAMVEAFRELVPPMIGRSIESLRKRGTTFAHPLLCDEFATIPEWFAMDEVKP